MFVFSYLLFLFLREKDDSKISVSVAGASSGPELWAQHAGAVGEGSLPQLLSCPPLAALHWSLEMGAFGDRQLPCYQGSSLLLPLS